MGIARAPSVMSIASCLARLRFENLAYFISISIAEESPSHRLSQTEIFTSIHWSSLHNGAQCRQGDESGAQSCSTALPCCVASPCPNWQMRCLSVHHVHCIHFLWVKPCIMWGSVEIMVPQLSLREFIGIYSLTSAGWSYTQKYLYDLPD